MKIVTEYWAKPIPQRDFDWTAVYDNYDLGCPIGYGRTKELAIIDLLECTGDEEAADEMRRELDALAEGAHYEAPRP